MLRNRPQSRKRQKKLEAEEAWLFAAPLICGLLLFFAFPLVYAIAISFTDYSFTNAATVSFIGFANYVRAFGDKWFVRSLGNALINAIGVPVGVLIALILSNLLTKIKWGSQVFRSIFFIPTICGSVAITFIWSWMYAPLYGLLSSLGTSLHWPTVEFLGEKYFFPSMIVMGIWGGLGTSILLLYAQLKNIPTNLYEAASVDGANAFQQFFYITIPEVSPVTFYIFITGISGSFQEFTRFQVMRGDALSYWSVMPVWYIYKYTTNSFDYEMGYASAMGILLGLIILLLSGIQYLASRYWVHYDE